MDIQIFVTPFDSMDYDRDVLAFFTDMAEMEVKARGFTLGNSVMGSDYSIEGEVSDYELQYADGSPVPEEWFALHMLLRNTRNGDIVVEQDMIFQDPGEVNEFFPLLVFNMIANIELTRLSTNAPKSQMILPPDDNRWRNKYLYLGLMALWSPRVYMLDETTWYLASFGAHVGMEWHLLSMLSFESGIAYAEDLLKTPDGDDAKTSFLEVPLLLKLAFKPGTLYMVEPYGGVLFNLPVGDQGIQTPRISWALGFQLGTKAGAGAIIADFRYAQDIGKSNFSKMYSPPVFDFQRQIITVGLGYKFGFGDRR